METLYVDVYFFINFSVNILSVYFALMLLGIPTGRVRAVLCALTYSLYAIAMLFIEAVWLKVIITALCVAFTCALISDKINTLRRIKFFLAFLVFETLLGGSVNFLYGLLDEHIYKLLSSDSGGTENRTLLIVSVAVLLSVGVFKLFLGLFSGKGRGESVEMYIIYKEKEYKAEAFVDTGNFLKDPITQAPVALIKAPLFKRIFYDFHDGKNYGAVGDKIKLIPISHSGGSEIRVGIKADYSYVISGGKREEVNIVYVIDNDGGSFGGFDVLVPSCAVNNV